MGVEGYTWQCPGLTAISGLRDLSNKAQRTYEMPQIKPWSIVCKLNCFAVIPAP